MFFWLKKLIGYWILPVPFCLALLVTGLVLLRWRPNRARLGRRLVATGVVLLLLLSNKFVSQRLVRPLERVYAPIPELTASNPLPREIAACRYVAVLGSGNGNTPGIAALNRLSTSGRARITEAVRLMRAMPHARLLVSGPRSAESAITHATVLEQAALSLGVEPERIARIELARDTEDEALAVKERVGDAPVVVVTSAWHMPRSMALFRSAGVNALADPTDYVSHDDGKLHWRDALWDFESIERSSFAIREYVGWTWIWLRGKTR